MRRELRAKGRVTTAMLRANALEMHPQQLQAEVH